MKHPICLGLVVTLALLAPAVVCAQSNYATPYTFTTLAGPESNTGSADGPGAAARFFFPSGGAVDSGGNVYVADTMNHTVRKITAGGVVTTLAGLAGVAGSADGTGSAARFQSLAGVAVDSSGNVYVADNADHTIRKITAGGVVTTLSGLAGVEGSTDGTGSAARFSEPFGLAADSTGNVYVADSGNHTIRKITSGGAVTTLAGTAGAYGSLDGTGSAARFHYPYGVAVDSAGNVYVADSYNCTIRKITAGGVVTTLAGRAGMSGATDGTGNAARFDWPTGIAVDPAGTLYVTDTPNSTVRKITTGGVVTTLAGAAGMQGWTDGAGSAARFSTPFGLGLDGAGNVFVVDFFNSAIRKISPGGEVTTFAGLGLQRGAVDGVGSAARFAHPAGVALDAAGTLYVAENYNHTIRKVTPGGGVTTLAGTAGVSGSADGTGNAARFDSPTGIAVDGAGNVYVADSQNGTIRKITAGGVVTTLAGTAGSFGSTDGTGSAARLDYPTGVTVDAAGVLYVTDAAQHTVRKITAAGVVTTLAGTAGVSGTTDGTGSAARFDNPTGLVLDSAGNLHVVDAWNETVRKITPAGVVTTEAGSAGNSGSADGTGTAARFNGAAYIAVDGADNLYVSERANVTIRKIAPGGVVTTLAGLVNQPGTANGSGSAARFLVPEGVAVDRAGNLYLADIAQNVIRWGAAAVPALTSAATASCTAGQSFTYAAVLTGAVGDYGASGLPAGLGLNAATGVISGTPASAGTYAITLSGTNGAGTSSVTFTLTVNAPAPEVVPTRLTNLSVRIGAGTGDNTLIVGFVVGGAGTSGTKPLLIRAVGPTLASYGVTGTLVDPTLELIPQGASTPLATNDNWAGDAQVTAVGNTVGAFPLSGAASKDAALYLTPASGVYTAKVTGVGGTSGIALAEIYDASSSAYAASTPRLINVSARAQVGTGDGVLIAGFVVDGTASRTVLIRAVGPTLGTYGVMGSLADPQLELTKTVNGATVVVATNDNWAGDAQIILVGTTVGAFALSGVSSKDAAILVTLPPGVYSAKATGVGNTTGVALIEVYEVP